MSHLLGVFQVRLFSLSARFLTLISSSARQLSCGHCFHGSCLRLWLEQDASCPTCRRKLNSDEPSESDNAGTPQEAPVWQINLRSISRWLPSLQVTVNYDLNAAPMNETRLQASVAELMQVRAITPTQI